MTDSKKLRAELQVVREVSNRCRATLVVLKRMTTRQIMSDDMTFTQVGGISHQWCVGIVSNDDVQHVVSQGIIDSFIMGVSKKHSIGAYGQIYGHTTKSHSLVGTGPTRDAAIDDLVKKMLAEDDISLKLPDGSFVKIPAAETASELKLKLDVLEPL